MHMVLLVYLSTLVTWTDGWLHDDADGYDYGIMLDAGSSGTKLKIYTWPQRNDMTEKIDINLVYNRKFKPGISEFARDLGGIKPYIIDIIRDAKEIVPKKKVELSPLNLMATAGMRNLENAVTENIMLRIEQVLRNTSINPFVIPEEGVRVLSGEEEGVFAWVAANYLRGFFWQEEDRAPMEPMGVLEMGGGSTQITFQPDGYIYANMFPVRLAGKTFHLYSHSYLLYGQNYIISRINMYLIALLGELSEVDNPCMLRGDNTTVQSMGKSVHVRGTGDVTKCLEILEIFLRTAEDGWCYPKPCAIGRTYQPEVGDILFYAISAFIYAPEYLEAIDPQDRLDLVLLKRNAIQHCSRTLGEVVATGLTQEYASSFCTMGVYIPSLLVDAYGFPENTTSIYLASKVNDVIVDWAMGAILLEIEYMQESLLDCNTSGSSSVIVDLPVVMSLVLSLYFYMLTNDYSFHT